MTLLGVVATTRKPCNLRIPLSSLWLFFLSLSLLVVSVSCSYSHPSCGSRRSILITFDGWMGYSNQMVSLAKALYLGMLTNRSVCMPQFKSDYRGPSDIPPQQFIDIKKSNVLLSEMMVKEGLDKDALVVTIASQAARETCVCLQGEPSVFGRYQCSFGRRTIRMKSIDPDYTNSDLLKIMRRPSIDAEPILCLSPTLPFMQFIPSGDESLKYSMIRMSLVHHPAMSKLANYVKSKEGICKKRCSGHEKYIASHVRLENDIIVMIQTMYGNYLEQVILPEINDIIVDGFLHSFHEFLKDHNITSVDKIHISSGLGKTKKNANDNDYIIDNFYRYKYRHVSTYNHQYFRDVITVASSVNKSVTSSARARHSIKDRNNVTNYFSMNDLLFLHRLMSNIRNKSRMREIHAVIDFLIASKASYFFGVCASTFTAGVFEFVKIKGCFYPNATRLQNPTQSEIIYLKEKFDILKHDPAKFFTKYALS